MGRLLHAGGGRPQLLRRLRRDGRRPRAGRTPQSFKGWATWSGTSFAAPKVAGEIAAIKTTKKLPSARAAAETLLARAKWLPDLGVVLNL